MSKQRKSTPKPTPKGNKPKPTPDQDFRIPAEQIEGARKWFEADAARWKEDKRTEDDLAAAFGYWIGYPHLLELIGRNCKIVGPVPDQFTLNPPESSWAAYYALNDAHARATHFLMVQAGRHGLDPAPLHECARVVQEIYAHEPWKYYAGLCDTWPECMGEARYPGVALGRRLAEPNSPSRHQAVRRT